MTTFSGPELCRYEAVEIVDLLRRRQVSPAELLDAAYERIATVEPVVNAMPIRCEARARKAAQLLDFSNEDEPGWLAGLPIAIKDLTLVGGVRSTFGTKGLAA